MVTAAPQDEIPVIPFVTTAAFKAHPTFLDLGNLRSGDSLLVDQDAELFNILLMASEMVENFCNKPIGAHIQTDYKRLWPDRRGRLYLYPDHSPVRALLSYAYAATLGSFTTVTAPLCQIEDGRQVIVEIAGAVGSWTGSLQFGAPAASQELYTQSTYVAGWANATIVGAPVAGATTITVSNPTGIFAGDTLRIWEPGKEESVVVASSWAGQNTSPFTTAAIPLVSGLTNAHTNGAGITGFGADLHLATIYFAVDGLQRWGTASSNWPGAKVKSATGKPMTATSPWEAKAIRLLQTYRDVR